MKRVRVQAICLNRYNFQKYLKVCEAKIHNGSGKLRVKSVSK